MGAAAPYAVLLHAASRAEKGWPESAGSRSAQARGERATPACFRAERRRSARPPRAWPRRSRRARGARSRPGEIAALLAHAALVAGVDTGLTHLAVALGRPTVGVYCATRPALTGLHGGGVNLGGPGQPPAVEAVAAALGLALAASRPAASPPVFAPEE
jgi:heptosyltransferase-1